MREFNRSMTTVLPMQFILKEERRGKKTLNKPVIYKDKTLEELIEQ